MPRMLVAKEDGTPMLDFELKPGGGYLVGRGPEATVRLEAPSISRLHALIYRQNGGWRVTDLGSSSGLLTTEGERRDVALVDEGWFRIGPAVFWYLEGDGSNTPPVTGSEPRPLDLLSARHTGTGRELLVGLTRPTIRIGTDEDCDIHFEGPGVEPLHCIAFRTSASREWHLTAPGAGGVVDASGGSLASARLEERTTFTVGPLECTLLRAQLPPKERPEGDDPGEDDEAFDLVPR